MAKIMLECLNKEESVIGQLQDMIQAMNFSKTIEKEVNKLEGIVKKIFGDEYEVNLEFKFNYSKKGD